MLPTPKYNLSNYPDVYEPSEDSFLFLDALEKECTFLQNLQPVTAVEIGSGSGIVITALSYILKNNCVYFATDINKQACVATQNTSTLNSSNINCINMDLLCCFKNNTFDIILFNPPYVVTEESEIVGNGLNRAWAGGAAGRTIIDKVLNNMSNLLTEKGICYMLLLKENDPIEVINLMSKHNIKGELIIERKIPGEHLYVYKFYKINVRH